MQRFLQLMVICSLLSGNLFAQFERMDSASLDTIEQFIRDQKAAEKIVGLSVGIIRNGEVVLLKGYGYRDSINQLKADEYTLYRLASISKTITGLMAMRLVEKGKLDLNKDIRDYVPEYPAKPEGTITSEDLLSNESGVIHYSGMGSGQYCQDNYDRTARDNYIAGHKNSYDPIAAMDIFKNQKICFKPGEHYQYTTWGFCLMGAVLQRAAGKAYEKVMADEVKCALDLPYLQIEYQDKRPYTNETKGYEIDGSGNVIPASTTSTDFKDVSYKTPGGGMISSVIDLTLLMKGIVNREFITDSTVKLFGTRHVPRDGKKSYYGYGTSTNARNGDTLYWHSGSQAKTATIIYYSPENKNGVTIMANTYKAGLFPLARLIYDYLPNVKIEGSVYQPLPAIPEWCTSSVSEYGNSSQIRIYPNPANNELNLEYNPKMGAKKLLVFDAQGRKIEQFALNGSGKDYILTDIPNGIYYIQIQGTDNYSSMQKLVIQH